jgi:hypothetical protein
MVPRRAGGSASTQDCVSYNPLSICAVPTCPKERVFYFLTRIQRQDELTAAHPDIETFWNKRFDAILGGNALGYDPPMSDEPKAVIKELNSSDNPQFIQERMHDLGDSVEKILLAGTESRQLKRQPGT